MQDWQDYHEIKEAYAGNNENMNFPEWYDYHNGKTGNGILLILPDIRGEKEKFYRDLSIEDSRKHTSPVSYVKDQELEKPYMNIFDSNLHIALAQLIEDKQTGKLIIEYLKGTEHHRTFENEKADENLEYLSGIKDQLVPIEAHNDYRIALSRAVATFKLTKTIEHLPMAYQKYKATHQLGISLSTEKEKEQFKMYMEISEMWKEAILRGRELNGEPKDFNF